MDRRQALNLAALSVTGALLAACDGRSSHAVTPSRTTPPSAMSHAPAKPSTPPKPSFVSQKLPALGSVSSVPVGHRQIALTIDDGVRPDVVKGYAELAHRTGLRLTFFANGCYDSWREAAPMLRPLVESGQVVIGNHTYSHHALTTLTKDGIARELQRNDRVLSKIYGKTTQPYVRPPYGYTNARVNRVLHDLGYRGVIMWQGTLGDEFNISPQRIMSNATQYLTPGAMVIGHANHPGILKAYDQLEKLISDRHLTTVTVADVWV